MNASLRCIHGFSSGIVQGVCYRQFTQDTANALGVSGWVRNLPDGRVEFTACGQPDAIAQLITHLHDGPPRAQVSHLDVSDIPTGSYEGFRILR